MYSRWHAKACASTIALVAFSLGILGLGILPTTVTSALAETNHHAVNFTLYYPVGTNQDPDVETNFRLSLIYGRVGAIRGIDLNTGVSIIQRDLSGFQATLLYSQVGGDFKGIAATGLVNYFQGRSSGLQLAGLANVDRGHFGGLQYSFLFNYVEGGLGGAQLSSVLNVAQGESGFLQLAGVANMSELGFSGVQIGGINFSGGEMRGVQLGLVNATVYSRGFQGGLINLAGEAHGIQLAPLNIHHVNHGTPIGLINIAEENGGEDWITFGSNLAAISTGMRTTVNRWYSLLSAGYGDLQGDVEESYFLSWNYGYAIPLAKKWALNVDLGFSHIIPEKVDDPAKNDRLHYAIQARVLAEFRLNRTLAFFAGGGVSSIYSEYSSDATQTTEPLGVVGISLF